jgi:hypothetical protein
VAWPKIKRNRKEMLRPKWKRRAVHHQHVKLAMIGDSVTSLGERQATVNGIPARLRHIIMVPPAGVTGKAATPTPVAQFLDTIRPDLSTLSAADYPKAEVWSDSHARSHSAPGKLGKGGRDAGSNLKTFRRNPAGNQSRLVELGQQSEASLASGAGDPSGEA